MPEVQRRELKPVEQIKRMGFGGLHCLAFLEVRPILWRVSSEGGIVYCGADKEWAKSEAA